MRALIFLVAALAACGQGDHAHEHGPESERGEHEDHAGEHADEVLIEPEAQARLGLDVGTPVTLVMGGAAQIPAEVQLVPQRTAHVAPLAPGRLVRVEAQIGEVVRAGQLLAVVSSAEVAALAAKTEQLKAQLLAARATLERQRKLAVDGIASQRAVIDAESLVRQLQAEAAGVTRQLELLGATAGLPEVALISPIDGVVVEAHATRGEMTRAEEPPFVVSDPSVVWAIGLVPELHVAQAAVGGRARLRLSAYPGQHWEGIIDFVSPSLDAKSRALPVRMTLENPDGRLRAGLLGTLELLSGGAEEAPVVAVPETSLVVLDGRDAIFVPCDEPNTFKPAFVELGRREGGFVEVRSGLTLEQALVRRGAFTLKSMLQSDALAEHEH